MVSVFYYALLTHRAVIFWHGVDDALPKFELAFEAVSVNWSPKQPYADMLGPTGTAIQTARGPASATGTCWAAATMTPFPGLTCLSWGTRRRWYS